MFIKESLNGTSTDKNGHFRLSNVEPGNRTLVVTYLGYETYEQAMEVAPGATDLGTIRLMEANASLGEVVVTGNMVPSQMKAMMIKRTSLPIMEVLAADAIGRLPDRNAAEAVQRLQGVSVNRYHGEANQASVRGTPYGWSSTLYNGTRLPSANVFGSRNAVLDAIPSEMIQYVQLSKAITPDIEGDAIGGSINFITRVAPEKRTLDVSLGGGYNQRAQKGTYNGSIVYGDRLFNNKLGFVIAASTWNRNWAADELAMEYNLDQEDPAQRYSINNVNAKRYIGQRVTNAINAGVEYEFNSDSRIFARLVRDRFDDIRPVYETYQEFNRNRFRSSYRYSDYNTSLDGLELGGEHKLGSKWAMDWRVSQYEMIFGLETPPNMPADQRGLPIAQFFQPLEGDFGGRSADGFIYHNFDAPTPGENGGDAWELRLTNPNDQLDAEKLRLEQMIIFQLNQQERDRVGELNFKYEPNSRLSVKTGVKGRFKQINNEMTPLVFLPNALLGIPGSTPMSYLSDFQRESFPIAGGFFNELGNPFDALIMDQVTQDQLWDIFSPEYFEDNDINDRSPASNATTRYNGTENVMMAYAMATYDLTEKLKVTGGVRNETTFIELNSSQFDAETDEVAPVTRNSNYNALLPMLHFKYAVKPNANIRAAYTRTFARANFGDLNPGENVDVSLGFPRITRGNTALQPTFSDNFDLMGEYFFESVGLVTGGLFYKNITDLIFQNTIVEEIDGINYLVVQPGNLNSSYLVGFETGITKRISKPGSWVNGFGVEANFTFIHSEVEVPRELENGEIVLDKTTLPNQSRSIFNTSIFYENKGLMLRVAGNFRGRSVGQINQSLGPDFYRMIDNNFTVDFSGSYAISDRVRIFAEVRNLTNEPWREYLGDDNRRIMSREWFSISGQLGVKVNFF